MDSSETITPVNIQELQIEFSHHMRMYNQVAAERRQFAADCAAKRNSLLTIKTPEINEQRELLAKFSCLADPNNKEYRAPWVQELALVDDPVTRASLIDDAWFYMKDLPKHQINSELKAGFHLFVGQRQVEEEVANVQYKASRKKPKPKPVQKKEELPIHLKQGQDVLGYIEEMVDSDNEGLNDKQAEFLSNQLVENYENIEPLQKASYLLFVSFAAQGSDICVKNAKKYIGAHIAHNDEKKELSATLNALREGADKKSIFYKEAQQIMQSIVVRVPASSYKKYKKYDWE